MLRPWPLYESVLTAEFVGDAATLVRRARIADIVVDAIALEVSYGLTTVKLGKVSNSLGGIEYPKLCFAEVSNNLGGG